MCRPVRHRLAADKAAMRANEARFQLDGGLALVERGERQRAAMPAFMRIAAPDQDFAHALRRESGERRHRSGCMRRRALPRGDGGLHGLVAVFPGGLGHGGKYSARACAIAPTTWRRGVTA